MVNFKIVEGCYDQEEKYQKFKRYYLERLDLNINQVLRECSINWRRYNEYLKRLYSETNLRRIPTWNGPELMVIFNDEKSEKMAKEKC